MPPLSIRAASATALALASVLPSSCVDRTPSPSFDAEHHREEIETWREERAASLREKDGWLTLVGLEWLEEGENRIGTHAQSDVVFPADTSSSLAPFMGVIRVDEEGVSLEVAEGVRILHRGEPVETMELRTDAEGAPTILEAEHLLFFLIQRGERIGVRIKDRDSPQLESFEGMEYFSIDQDWRKLARFERYDPPRTIPVPNIIGTPLDEPSPGVVTFEHRGKTFRLDALPGGDESELFFVFGDTTNGNETYGGGRFVYATLTQGTDRVIVDFNKSYNPPCVFTPYATCPLPPPQNRLDVAIRAGEKAYGAGHH